jgi:hypothetical protein
MKENLKGKLDIPQGFYDPQKEEVTKRRHECFEIFEGSPNAKSGNTVSQPAAGRRQNTTAPVGHILVVRKRQDFDLLSTIFC